MPKYYIHAEAFNLSHMVYDTNDISTIRGGSFILLDAVKRLPEAFPRLKSITTAASKGLFSYDDPGNLATQQTGMAQQVLRNLYGATSGNATFLVAIEEDIPGDFLGVLERLEAEVRRQQWRMPTVVVPLFEDSSQECYLDGWRPGVVPYTTIGPEVSGIMISAAADSRRNFGRKIKHQMFSKLLKDPTYDDDLVAKDLGKLATDDHKGILNGKIALIQVDGNSFGRIRKKTCDTPAKREGFDKAIQEGCRNAFLHDLLTSARVDPDFLVMDRGKMALRIELLLWGGDEFTLVVPAWKGLEVMESFFHCAEKLQFGDMPMTHRAAIIFCHHDAPILQIRKLADELLGMTKKNITMKFKAALDTNPTLNSLSPEDRNRQIQWLSNAKYGNAAQYLVLESFDMLRGSLEQFLKRYYGKADNSDMLLYGQNMSELRGNLQTICAAAPKGRVVEIAHAMSKGDDARVNELRKRLPDSIAPEKRDAVLAAIENLTGENNAGWYLLADLWDYAEGWKA